MLHSTSTNKQPLPHLQSHSRQLEQSRGETTQDDFEGKGPLAGSKQGDTVQNMMLWPPSCYATAALGLRRTVAFQAIIHSLFTRLGWQEEDVVIRIICILPFNFSMHKAVHNI